MSFHEKSLWLTLAGLLGAFGWYFAAVLPAPGADVLPSQVGTLAVAVALLVVAEIAGHIVIAVVDRRTARDERDRLVQLKGMRNGAIVLAAGVFWSLCTAIVTDGNFWFVHVLLAFWVLAQVVEIASQLAMYRLGV